jgi:hypothetical protein
VLFIKDTIDDGQEPKIDFKMDIFKPIIYFWLHEGWTKVKAMKRTINKIPDKTSIILKLSYLNFS